MAEKIIIDLEAKTDKAIKEIEKVSESITELNQEVVKGNKNTSKSLESVEKSANIVSKGIKGLGLAMKALGIGLLMDAWIGIKDIFRQNQRVVDVLSTAFETFSIVINQVVSAFISTYDAVAKSSENFNGLSKVLGGLITIGITPLKLGFYAIKLGLQQAQLAWENSFFGGKDQDKIKRLQADIKETKDNISGVATDAVSAGKDIYNNFSDAVDGISNISIKAAYEQAQLNTQLEKNAKLATVANQGLIEQYDREAELLRQLRDDTSKSIEERIKANEDLGLVLEKQQAAMQENAKTIVLAAQAQYEKNKNDENAVALQEALNEQAAIDAQITGFKSEQQTNLNSLLQEQKDIQNELALIGKSELETAKIEAEQKLQTQIDLITREVENEEERNALLLEAKRVYEEEIKAIDDEVALKAEENRQIEIQAKKDALAKEAELEKEKVQMKVDALNAIMSITNSETALGKAAFIAKQLLAGKEMLAEAKNTLGRISLRASEATVATAAGAANTAKVGFPQNIPLLIGYAAQAVGIIGAIKSAVSTAKGSISAAGAGGSVPNIQAPRGASAAAPSFNIVGQGGTNQLAESIGNQEKQPIKAYVVSNDVTTAQSMERNIVESASI